MYVITYKNKPVTIERLGELDNKCFNLDEEERQSYLTSKTKRGCINHYIYYFGFTWKERLPGVDVWKVII